MKRTPLALTLMACVLGPAAPAAAQGDGHFDPKGKPASHYTVERNQALRASLPFEDRRDFERALDAYQRIVRADAKPEWTAMAQGRIEAIQETLGVGR